MKTNFLPKVLLLFVFCLILNSCTTDDAPEQNSLTLTAEEAAQGGPVIPPGPKP
jgi:hypothetical protein